MIFYETKWNDRYVWETRTVFHDAVLFHISRFFFPHTYESFIFHRNFLFEDVCSTDLVGVNTWQSFLIS